jgi:integrase/recombinase XerD
MFTFYLNKVLPELGLSLNAWSDDIGKIVSTKINNPDIVRKLCGTSGNANRKLQWLRIFCTYLAPCDVDLKAEWVAVSAALSGGIAGMFSDGSDHHRISVGDLERIYAEVQTNPLHELIYMILITTGMRVGGLAQIKIEHVAIPMSNDVEIKESGRTIEKNKKWFTFMMSESVRNLMYDWIVNHRPADPSPYVFPGQSASRGHMTTATIRNMFHGWCKAAGLTGKEFHPHSLRHSYAHILLESDNSVDVVSKLLNHSSTKVTEQFYLKENASEVAERANIPWLTKETKKKRQIVPAFLVQKTTKALTDDTRQQKKRRKAMGRLNMFTDSLR